MATRSKPIPKSQKEISRNKKVIFRREDVTSRKDDNIGNFNVTLYDIDTAIKFYFDDVINPQVEEMGEMITVPTIYGGPERWKSVQRDGFYRDLKGKIQTPLIMYRRTSVQKNDQISVDKLDANSPNIFYPFIRKFSERNRYDKFSILFDQKPQKEFFNIVIPDYVILTYDCIIWSDFLEQMNKIVEAVNYSEGAYWGDPERFKFLATIDSFDITTEVAAGTDRLVRTNFSLALKGYIIPDALNKEIAMQVPNLQKTFSTTQIIINENTVDADVFTADPITTENIVEGSQMAVANEQQMAQIQNAFKYLEKNIQLNSSGSAIVSGSAKGTGTSTVTYPNTVTASIPTGEIPEVMSQTELTDFIFFVNGQYIEHDAITVAQTGPDFVVFFDELNIGYPLDDDDEVVVWGKFEE